MFVEDVTEQERLESQLIQSEKMAAVGQLVSGVAHELNNPLTSVAGLAEFLLEQPVPSERDREHLRVIREQADRATQIVRNLLTFARKGPAEVERYQLNELVERTVSLVGFEARLQEITIDVTLDPALPALLGDRYQIQQVVLNLVTNAIQAVRTNPPARARRVRIATLLQDDLVTLRVADSGPGIDAALLPHIFTPFVTTKDPGQGTGLGLSISYRILEGHGGSLGVERPDEGGAVFVMQLPANAAPARAPEAASALKLTAKDLFEMRIIDGIIKEPLGGAHRGAEETAENIKEAITRDIPELRMLSKEKLVEARYAKFRSIGIFKES